MSNKNSNAIINGEKFCYNINEVAEMLGVTRQTVQSMIRRGYLACVNISTGSRATVRILKSDFDSYIKHLKEEK